MTNEPNGQNESLTDTGLNTTAPLKRTYVEFLKLIGFFPDFEIREVPSREADLGELPERAVAFRFFDRTIFLVNGKEVSSKEPLNVSGFTYIDAEVLSFDDVKRTVRNYSRLLSSMNNRGINYAVRTKTGDVFPLEKGENVINKDREVIYTNGEVIPPTGKFLPAKNTPLLREKSQEGEGR
jgi:hypothetical protein